jgi:hypothetical protein
MPRLLRRLALPLAAALALVGCAGGEPDQDAATPQWTVPAATAPATTPPRAASPTSRAQLPPGVLPAGERRAAPGLSVVAFDGRTVTLGGFRGQPVVLNFFESW